MTQMKAPSVRQIIAEPRSFTWWGLTLILVFWAMAGGSGYVVLGDSSAGPVYYVIRAAGGVVLHNAITFSIGLAMVATVRTRAAAATTLLFGFWCLWMSSALFFGFLWARNGWSGWVGWMAFALLAFFQYVTAPRSMFLVPKGKNVVVTHIPARDVVHKRSPAPDLRTRTGDA